MLGVWSVGSSTRDPSHQRFPVLSCLLILRTLQALVCKQTGRLMTVKQWAGRNCLRDVGRRATGRAVSLIRLSLMRSIFRGKRSIAKQSQQVRSYGAATPSTVGALETRTVPVEYALPCLGQSGKLLRYQTYREGRTRMCSIRHRNGWPRKTSNSP